MGLVRPPLRCWPYSSPSSKYLSKRNTFLDCQTSRWTCCCETMLLYSSHSSCKLPGVPWWSLSWSQLSSTWNAPGHPKSGWRGSVSVCPGFAQSTYVAGKRRYLSCTRANLNQLLDTEAMLCRFVAHVTIAGLSSSLGTFQWCSACRLRWASQRRVPPSSICPRRSQQEPCCLWEAQETADYPNHSLSKGCLGKWVGRLLLCPVPLGHVPVSLFWLFLDW